MKLSYYYNVGKMIIKAQGGEERAKYGNDLIKKFSKRLTYELGKGYSWRNSYNMRTYYLLTSKYKILQPVVAQSISWSHYTILMSLKDINEINYYIEITINQKLSYRKLREKIKSKEYQRLSDETKNKLIKKKKK